MQDHGNQRPNTLDADRYEQHDPTHLVQQKFV